jgi:hypothetical protein
MIRPVPVLARFPHLHPIPERFRGQSAQMERDLPGSPRREQGGQGALSTSIAALGLGVGRGYGVSGFRRDCAAQGATRFQPAGRIGPRALLT